MKKLVLLILIWSPIQVFSQSVLLQEDVNADTIPEKFGANRKHYYHNFISVGLAVAGEENFAGAKTKPQSSTDLLAGIRYKRRFSDAYSIGLDAAYRLTSFNYKQFAAKTFPTTTIHQREKFNLNAIHLGLFNRLNFGRRGNYIGNFLDVGAYSDVVFNGVYRVRDNYWSPAFKDAVNSISRVSGVDIIERFNYGIMGRIGLNKLVFYGSYRLSEVFTKGYPEPPKLIIGLQIGMHK